MPSVLAVHTSRTTSYADLCQLLPVDTALAATELSLNGPAWAKAVPVGPEALLAAAAVALRPYRERGRPASLSPVFFLSCEAGCWCTLGYNHAAVKIPAIVSFRPLIAVSSDRTPTDRPKSREFQVVVLGAGEYSLQ